jgi:PAS domain S-box-containing protein
MSERNAGGLEPAGLEPGAARPLLSSDGHLSQVLANMAEGVALISSDGRIIEVNPAATGILRLPARALTGASVLDPAWRYLGPDGDPLAREGIITWWQRMRRQPCDSVLMGIHLDGACPVWIEARTTPLQPTGPAAGHVLAIFRDAGAPRQAEEARREGERFMRAVIDTDPNVVFVKDGDGRYVLVNDALARVYGLSPDDLLGYTDVDLCARMGLDVAQAQQFQANDRYVLESGSVHVIDERFTLADGTDLWYRTTKTPLRYHNAPGHIMGVAVDITESVRAQQALRESEKRYRTLVESLDDAIFLLADDGRITECNAAAGEMFGYDRAQLAGMNISELVSAEVAARLREVAAQLRETAAVRDASEGGTWEATGAGYAGASFPIEVSARPVVIQGRRLLLVAVRDVTDRHRLQEQLRQSQKMDAVGRLAGGIAHDFNNLLTIINGYSEFLLRSLPPGGEAQADMEQIHQAGRRAAELTRQLLAFSRRQMLELRLLNLNEVIDGLGRMLRRIISEDIHLTVRTDPTLGAVKADIAQIEQLIINLMLNARDAMPGGGALTLETANVELPAGHVSTHLPAHPGPHVMLAVTDTGMGMDEAVRERMFEPFYTTKEVGKGTGLGLAVVYGIVQDFGGSMDVASAPGRGTTLRVYLPCAAQATEAGAPDGAGGDLPTGRETVLVVEDQDRVRRLVVRMLGRLGYTVLEASCASEAISLCRSRPIPVDLLLTDVVMPGMSGPELVRRLSPICGEVPVLYMSGYADEAIAERGGLEGAPPLIRKPFTIEHLARALRQALEGVAE